MALPPQPMGSIVDSGFMQGQASPEMEGQEIEVIQEETFEGGAEITPGEDGSALIQALSGMEGQEVDVAIEHDENLAEYLDEGYLGELSSELRGSYEDDLVSRSEWEEAYTNGLDQLGVKQIERAVPFEGASGVTHPLIMESVTQFQAQAYKELLPSGGPVKTQVLGLQSAEHEAQAHRVRDYMNYQIMEVMQEYDPDMDQLLFYLPLSGSTFKKVYYDPTMQRAVSKFLPAQDLVVPYSATDLATASRVTHVLRMDSNEVRKMQVAGFYRDIELTESDEEDIVKQKVNELDGISKTYMDDVYTVLEMHVNLDLEGFEDKAPDGEDTGIQLPYIVAIDQGSGEILSIRRNFEENSDIAMKRQYFVHYKFMPGLGFYGFGLIHMIGGLGRSATSILRQLIDAGTLANLPAGFKARGVRVRNSDDPLQPGEWRDIDVPGGDIRSAITPLPYKEPSGTLAQLLGVLIEGGRRFISLADEQVNNMNQETPVGTTVAMLERGMKVMSAIHKRLHYAQKTEFRLLATIFSENMPAEYPYEVAGAPQSIKAEDFDGRVDVIPVSDPNIFSMAQRVTLAQSQLQLAQTNPQIHNIYAAYKRMYQALEVQNIDEILPPIPEPKPLGPAVENARALMGELLQAFEDQDHETHISIHLMFLKTPLVVTSPQVQGTFYAHIQEHISMKAKQMVEEELQTLMQSVQMNVQAGGVDPALAQQKMQEMQQQMQVPGEMDKLIAMQELQLMQKYLPDMMPPPADPMADPLVQIRMQELGIKQETEQRKAMTDQADLMLETEKLQQKAVTDSARLELQEEIAEDRNEVNRERIDVQKQAVDQRAETAATRSRRGFEP